MPIEELTTQKTKTSASKEFNNQARQLLLKILQENELSNIKVYINVGSIKEVKEVEFDLDLSFDKEAEIKLKLTKDSIEKFKSIDEDKVIKDVEKFTKEKKHKNNFITQFNKIKDNVERKSKISLDAQTICIAYLRSFNLGIKSISYNAYCNCYFKIKELLPESPLLKEITELCGINTILNLPVWNVKNDTINIEEISKFVLNVKISLESLSPNIIFFGSPGTGKSNYVARLSNILAQLLSGSIVEKNISRTIFHPEYSYYDFIGQYKPVVGQEEVKHDVILMDQTRVSYKPFVYYDFVPGLFSQFIVDALKNPGGTNILIIEEINRGNVCSIFGEIFQLLDRNEAGGSQYGIKLPYEMEAYIRKELGITPEEWTDRFPEGFKLPSNVYFFATMNTSDESVFIIDEAFKRRWDMRYVKIDYEAASLQNCFLPQSMDDIKWLEFIKEVNKVICKNLRNEDKQIGPWFISARELEINESNSNYVKEEVMLNKVFSHIWFNIIDINNGEIFNENIECYQDLFNQKSIKNCFSENFISLIKESKNV